MALYQNIGLLHGYLLDGSGSNLWTRSVIESLCRQGTTVHLFCQENHGDLYPFISELRIYEQDGSCRAAWKREPAEKGTCILHKPVLGDTLPVFVRDRYEEFANPVPMIELPDEDIEAYLDKNVSVVARVVEEENIPIIHANHAVLMPEVARRVHKQKGTPFIVMPHGSDIEYAVKKDPRFYDFAASGFREAAGLFVISREIRERILDLFPDIKGLGSKMEELHLGVDTSLFRLVESEKRVSEIKDFLDFISEVERGKKKEMHHNLLRDVMNNTPDPNNSIAAVLNKARAYDNKKPDDALEEAIEGIDWKKGNNMIFAGRLISGKGFHAVIGALPRILERYPRLHLFAAGHGPQREVMELFLHALQQGEEELARFIVKNGKKLEGSAPYGPYVELEAYWNALGEQGTQEWFSLAKEVIKPDSVIFTGYLTHPMLRYLFSCSDIAVFPSVVKEAGPLVFLEALASGVFPLGTDFGGMKVSINSTIPWIGEEAADAMRLRPDPRYLVSDIVDRTLTVLSFNGRYRSFLRKTAIEKYDWSAVTGRMQKALRDWA